MSKASLSRCQASNVHAKPSLLDGKIVSGKTWITIRHRWSQAWSRTSSTWPPSSIAASTRSSTGCISTPAPRGDTTLAGLGRRTRLVVDRDKPRNFGLWFMSLGLLLIMIYLNMEKNPVFFRSLSTWDTFLRLRGTWGFYLILNPVLPG